MVQRVSVRRARIEEQRARKQIIIASVVAVVMGGIFFLVIFPLMLRGVVYLAQRGSVPTVEVPLPPQAPQIAAPAKYNNTGSLELTGFTSPEVDVKLIVSEQERESTKSDDQGAFSFDVNLDEGEYELFLFAEGKDKNTSPDSTRYKLVVDQTKPSLTIESPADGAAFALRKEQNQTFKGKLSEPGYVIINNNSRIRTNSEGVYQAQIQLPDGETIYSFVGEDLAGNQSVKIDRKVRFN